MFTPTQQRIIEVLSDGMPHSKQELQKCLWDDLGTPNNIWMHIGKIRKVLRPKGEDILCEFIRRAAFYRHVRLLVPANDGRR